MARVVRPGGRVVVLEITTPQKPPLSFFFRAWFDTVVPALGRVAGDADAYTYLPSRSAASRDRASWRRDGRRRPSSMPSSGRSSRTTPGDAYFIVLRTARYDDAREEVEFGEIHIFVGLSYVVIVRHGEASDLRGARQRLEDHPEIAALGP